MFGLVTEQEALEYAELFLGLSFFSTNEIMCVITQNVDCFVFGFFSRFGFKLPESIFDEVSLLGHILMGEEIRGEGSYETPQRYAINPNWIACRRRLKIVLRVIISRTSQ